MFHDDEIIKPHANKNDFSLYNKLLKRHNFTLEKLS